jgi:hypothetical protein
MKILHIPMFTLSTVLLLGGCTGGTTVSTDQGSVASSLSGKTITLRADGFPNAQIDDAGALSIDGKPVAMNAAQRALLLRYQGEMAAMTADGIAIGKQGAALAGTAVSEAIKGAIKGDTDQVESKMEAKAKKIEQQAMRLCARLVTIKASQDALAAQLPAFKPYATISEVDVSDCDSNQGNSYAAGKEVGQSLGKAVEGGQSGNASLNAADEADAASAKR